LFEIKFVTHQDPFYQLGKLYVYKLQIELFQYASEKIDTGLPEIDVFENLKTFDVEQNVSVETSDSYGDNNNFKREAVDVLFDKDNPFGEIVTTYDFGNADSIKTTSEEDKVTTDTN
jgi:hypothetical protein